MEKWDLIIVGAGAAGLTAGIYGARSGLKTLILDEKQAGGTLIIIPWVENYPGFPDGVSGEELAKRMLNQCRRFGVEIHEFEGVEELRLDSEYKIVETSLANYMAESIIIASGSRHKKLGVPGEEEFEGRGVSYCALCDGAFFRGLRVLVVGGGNTAAISAIYLANLASKVYLAHRRDQLRADDIYSRDLALRGVEILWNTEVRRIEGNSKVRRVILFDRKTGDERELSVDGLFIFVGEVPNSEFAKKAGVMVDEGGYIIVDALQRTNIKGVYGAGDVTACPIKQIGTAVGQAIIAATEAFKYVRKPYYSREA
ncbi:MAG: thioredoxin-disulfide reductase [Candidatus Bathyarchaeia archaeon]